MASPLPGKRAVIAASVLVGEAAEGRVARVECLPLVLDSSDERVPDGSSRKPAIELCAQDAPASARPVDLIGGQEVAVGGAQDRCRELALPRRVSVADRSPQACGRELVAAAVERIDMGEGERVEAVELASAG